MKGYKYVVSHDELFNFAAQPPFEQDWNACCQIFFKGNILTYQSWNQFEANAFDDGSDLAFMQHHNLDEMLVVN